MSKTEVYVWDMVVHFHKMFSQMYEALGERIQFGLDVTFSGNSLSEVVELTDQALRDGVLDEHLEFKKQVEDALCYIEAHKTLIVRYFNLRP